MSKKSVGELNNHWASLFQVLLVVISVSIPLVAVWVSWATLSISRLKTTQTHMNKSLDRLEAHLFGKIPGTTMPTQTIIKGESTEGEQSLKCLENLR